MLFTRRPSARFHRGRLPSKTGPAGGPSGPTQLWTLVSSVTCLRAWQSDFGLTMGGTPLPSGTTPPNVTLTGGPAGNVALRLEIQTSGAAGVATYRYGAANDGTTSATWIESGKVVPAGGGTYAAIGALAGVTFNFPNATYSNTNVYQGTCAMWTDQVNAKPASQAASGQQPLILIGANGHPVLRFDGVNDCLFESTLDVPAPGTTPTFLYGVARVVSWAVTTGMVGLSNTATTLLIASGGEVTPNWHCSNGAVSSSVGGATVGSIFALENYYANSGADYLKLGSVSSTLATLGNLDPGAGVIISAGTTGQYFSNTEFYDLNIFNGKPTSGELSALRSAVSSMYPGILV